MDILEELNNKNTWYSFLNYKIENGTLFFEEEKELRDFIDKELYKEKVQKLNNQEYCFSVPQKMLVNKMGSTKKRVVYTFLQDENYILKLIAFLLHKYDNIFSPNLYSFRQHHSPKAALQKLTKQTNVYCYKVDIHNYFNSIDAKLLLAKLSQVIHDKKLMWFFTKILSQNKCIFDGKEIAETMGGMAGIPISAFFANVYLMDMDQYFFDHNITYARYSDDIVIFCKSRQELEEHIKLLHSFIKQNNLQINSEKENIYTPSDSWEFLGISCHDKEVDLSSGTLKKIKGKIRRKCRALYRWQIKKGAPAEKAIKATIKIFNRKFYDINNTIELTWSKWFFPVLTTDKSLKIIDNYLEENLRYISTGRHTKKNYKNVPYKKLKELGYIPLVSAFWEYKKATLNGIKNKQ